MLDATATERALQISLVAFRGTTDVIDATGPDVVDYLHGQLSQDVVGLAQGESRFSLLLAPQGKIDAWFRITRLGEQRFWLDLAAGYGAAALERLERFKLRVDAEFSLHQLDVVAVRGPADAVERATGEVEAPPEGAKLTALWPGEHGFDLIGSEVGLPAGIDEGAPEVFDALRIRLGRPSMGAELDEKTIPAAAGVVDGSVDFTKGCYVGQELVARIDSRGSNTPTRLCGLRLTDDSGNGPVAAGAEITQDGMSAGRVTSVASGPGGIVGLAYVKRAVDVPSAATVTDEAGEPLPVELTTLPMLDPNGISG